MQLITIEEFLQHAQSTTGILASVVLIAIVAIVQHYVKKYKNLPPGPTGVPFLGYWPFLDRKTCHLQFLEMQKKYGDVFIVNVAGKLFLNIGSHKVLREAHVTNSESFANRTSDYSLMSLMFEDGVAFINGEPWKVLRKYFLQEFRERGLTSLKENTAQAMLESAAAAVDEIRAQKGEPFNIVKLLTPRCTHVLQTIMFGGGGVTDDQIAAMNDDYAASMQLFTHFNMLLSGRISKFILIPLLKGIGPAMKSHKRMEDALFEVIYNHKATFDEHHSRSIIDSYFKERMERKKKGDPTARYFTDKALMRSLVQFVGDGVLSVAGFTSDFFKSLLEHPEEQDKIYQELIEVTGQDRLPTVEDRSKLPYLNAFILEVLRLSDFFPFFPSLECVQETTIKGYRIPKGTITLMNMWSIHRNPDVYKDPETFNPSRFISRGGKPREELPITFGVGKRSCLGEGYTMNQVFLFLATIIKNFELSVPEDAKKQRILESFVFEVRATPRTKH